MLNFSKFCKKSYHEIMSFENVIKNRKKKLINKLINIIIVIKNDMSM